MTPFTPGALAGIRVVDLSRILGGPLCGQILGDHGADVLKIEPPQGDEPLNGHFVIGQTGECVAGVRRHPDHPVALQESSDALHVVRRWMMRVQLQDHASSPSTFWARGPSSKVPGSRITGSS